jgi:DNA-binding NtrC family response regulator
MAKISAGPRVLIVDDEPLIRWSLAETFKALGHLVAEAGDGAEALRALERGDASFDVVLLDYRLPDSDSLSLLSRIRTLAPSTRVIMMTAFGTPEVTSGALALGAYQVVRKPFEVHEMAALVAQAHAYRG